jgi:ankyrin repeat protein
MKYPPLVKASMSGCVKSVVECLKNKENVSQVDFCGSSAVLVAAAGNHHEIVALLLEAGARADTVDYCGSTPLMWAAKLGHIVVMQQLLTAGADVNADNKVVY